MKKLSLILFAAFCFTFPVDAQNSVDSIVGRAKNMVRENLPGAIEEIGTAIAIEPQNAELYLTRAEFYFLSQNKPALLMDAQKAVSLAPADRKVLYRAASILHRSQQQQEALKIVNELAALGDLDRMGWGLRIQIKTFLKDYIGAFDDATKAVELFPQDDYLKQVLANLVLLLGDSKKALEMYDAIIDANEKKFAQATEENEKTSIKRALSLFLFNRARLNLAEFSKEQALLDLIKAVEYLPEGNSYYLRARIYAEHKMYTEALADYTKILDANLKFDKSIVYMERADVYFRTQKYAEAAADYEMAVKLNNRLREPAQRRIAAVKQKMAETTQPK